MSKDICVQLAVQPGDRVQIVLHELCLRAGGGKYFPNGGTGTVTEHIVGNRNHGHYDDYGKLAYVKYDEPFIKHTDAADKEGIARAKVMMEDWVPTWLLVRLPELKPETES